MRKNDESINHDYDDEVDGNGNDFEEVDDKDVNEKVCDRKQMMTKKFKI